MSITTIFYERKFAMDNTIFSQRLKEARISAKLTQTELAKISGVTAATISAYECSDGKKGKNPSLENALKLAQALNISLDWLCGSVVNKTKVQISDFLKTIVKLSEVGYGISVDRVDFANNSYADKLLPKADSMIDYDVFCMERDCAEHEHTVFKYEISAITFGDWLIDKFLSEWDKMRELYYKKTIDEGLYKLWLDKQFSDIDKEQKRREAENERLLNCSAPGYEDITFPETPTNKGGADNGEHN